MLSAERASRELRCWVDAVSAASAGRFSAATVEETAHADVRNDLLPVAVRGATSLPGTAGVYPRLPWTHDDARINASSFIWG